MGSGVSTKLVQIVITYMYYLLIDRTRQYIHAILTSVCQVGSMERIARVREGAKCKYVFMYTLQHSGVDQKETRTGSTRRISKDLNECNTCAHFARANHVS